MKKIGCIICGLLMIAISMPVIADTLHFTCSGVTTGSKIAESPKSFDITIETSPPNLIGPIGPLGFCSLTLNKLSKVSSSCQLTETELICRCEGGGYIINSIHQFSRLSGNLTFYSFLKNDVREGKYKCSPISRKLF
jgi:hypothetical protein